ncbi:MAG: primase-helicase family protein [Methylocella sp.]
MNAPLDPNRFKDVDTPTREFVCVNGAQKILTDMAALNARFALLQAPGGASIYISRSDFLPIQDSDLKRRLACEVVVTGRKDDRDVYSAAYSYWTGHAERHVYKHIAFTSEPLPPDTLNLFRGLGVKPKAGPCQLILDHVIEVICAGDINASDAMLKLLAWQIQNIGKPSRIIPVLKTAKQQAGKGILLGELMAKIYGQSGFTAADTDQILGRFNDALRGTSFIFLDEVLFSGDKQAADQIKSLSTCTQIGIETKGLPIVQCPIGVNLWLASNHENAAHIEEWDQRYWVINCSEHRIGDADYFAELMREINHGGREAFAYYLLMLDVSEFVPSRDIKRDNDARQDMIIQSVNPYDAKVD